MILTEREGDLLELIHINWIIVYSAEDKNKQGNDDNN